MHKIIGKKIAIQLWVYFVPNLFQIHTKRNENFWVNFKHCVLSKCVVLG